MTLIVCFHYSTGQCDAPPAFHNCIEERVAVYLPFDSDVVTVDEDERIIRQIYATSCSGVVLDVNISHTFHWNRRPQALPILAVDENGLQSSCVINIIVKDTFPPVFIYCPDSQTIPTSRTEGVSVSWQLPEARDNSGIVTVKIGPDSRTPATIFPPGDHTVVYDAYDGASNRQACQFHIDVQLEDFPCTDPEPILNGDLECNDQAGMSMECTFVGCRDGYWMNQTIDTTYRCNNNGQWTPHFPELFQQQACFKPEKLFLELKFQFRLKESSPDIAIRRVLNCFEVGHLCPDETSTDVDMGFFLCNSSYLTVKVEPGSNVVNISGETTTFLLDPQKKDEVVKHLIRINTRILHYFENEEFVEFCSDLPGTYGGGATETDPTEYCPTGQVLWQSENATVCVKCNIGTMYNNQTGHCDICPMDTYQDEEAQLYCKPCPRQHRASFRGAFLEVHCEEEERDDTMGSPVIAGIATGGCVVIVLIISVFYYLYKVRHRTSRTINKGDASTNNDVNPYSDLHLHQHQLHQPYQGFMHDSEIYDVIPIDIPLEDEYLTPTSKTTEIRNPVYNDDHVPMND